MTNDTAARRNGITSVVFDLGGVLIDWNPRYLYRGLFEDEAEMERFLTEVCTLEWNGRMDTGVKFADAVAELSQAHPEHAEMIRAYHLRWHEMLGGPVPGTLEILRRLKADGVPVYALSNWSAETFDATRRQFPFLDEFDGILISGEVGVGKPNAEIFEHLIDRFGLDPAATVFIDDWDLNVRTASRLGFVAIQFFDAEQVAHDLRGLGLAV